MAQPGLSSRCARLHHDEVEAQRQSWYLAAIQQPIRGLAQPGPLSVVDGLLGEPEVAACAPAHLDHDEREFSDLLRAVPAAPNARDVR